MSRTASDGLAEIRDRLTEAVACGDAAALERALEEAMSGLHNQVVAAHIAVVRRCCGGDAELAIRIANALCDAGAGRLQHWALRAGRWNGTL